ncbi:MAG: endonuclease III [Ectothiorhodospiraceae bacterium]|nr:endonuclease III [Ectothiorhodospiraceae bacterium]
MSEKFAASRKFYESESATARKRRARAVIKELYKEFPQPECALLHKNPFQLLIATILSAQSTDEQVNKITPKLFAEYPDAGSMSHAPMEHLIELIRTTGFFNNKAKNIKACASALIDDHGGKVPQDMDALTALPGVGRKTANVVLGNAFDIPGLPVDTHVKRIANLLALTDSEDPEKIEQQLCAMLPEEDWTDASHLLILHGRKTCIARRPQCEECRIERKCPGSRLSATT